MAKHKIHLAVALMEAKLLAVCPSPGPILLMAVPTEPNAVRKSSPVASSAKVKKMKINT